MNCNDVQQLAALYISGELDSTRLAEFQAHLDGCGECRAGITGQIELDSRLRDEILRNTPDSSALESRVRSAIALDAKQYSPPVRRAVAAVAAMLLLAVGIVLATRLWVRPQPVQLCSDAARDHLREIVRQEPRRWTSDRSGIDAIAQRIGVSPGTVGNFSAPGYLLERGRLCRLDGHAFLHLVYSNGTRRFSMFLAPARGSQGASGLFTTSQNGEQIATVQSNRQRAVVVTEESPDSARALARIALSVL